MSIDSKLIIKQSCVTYDLLHDAVPASVSGYTMHYGIWAVIQPGAVDYGISGIRPWDQRKHGIYVPVVFCHTTDSAANVFFYDFTRRMSVAPLGGVSSTTHKITSSSIYFHQTGQILPHSRSNEHCFLPPFSSLYSKVFCFARLTVLVLYRIIT